MPAEDLCCSGGTLDGHQHNGGSVAPDPHQTQAQQDQEDREERVAFERVLRAFRAYETKLVWELDRWQRNYERLPAVHQALLPGYPVKVARARSCISANQAVIRQMLDAFTMGPEPTPNIEGAAAAAASTAFWDISGVSTADIDKVSYVFKNIMRDWSAEGAEERDASHRPIIEQLMSHFPQVSATTTGSQGAACGDPDCSPPGPRVLVPGAGLGRLCLDIAAKGFQAEGNEHSWYMLIASNFLLNCTSRCNQLAVHPWAALCNNQRSLDLQLREVTFPDRLPGEACIREGSLSMSAGDFLEVYGSPSMAGQFDAVVTCFFIDTAHVITEYLQVIHRVLVEGGIWINFGPLLWHWSDSHLYLSSDEISIEITLEEVLEISSNLGFKMLQQKTMISPYTSDKHSMMSTDYKCEFWTMQRI